MEIDFAVLADAATVDATGKLNILGIFDRISTGGFPAQHPRMALVLRYGASVNDAGDHKVEIVFRGPEGGELGRIQGDMKVGVGAPQAGSRIRVPQVINMERLVFPKPGRYSFDVSVNGEHQVSVPLFLHDSGPKGKVPQA